MPGIVVTAESERTRLQRVIETSRDVLGLRAFLTVTSREDAGESQVIENVYDYNGDAALSTKRLDDVPNMMQEYLEQVYYPKWITQGYELTDSDKKKKDFGNIADRASRSAQYIVRKKDEDIHLNGDSKLGLEGIMNKTGRNLFVAPDGNGVGPTHEEKTAAECLQDVLDSIEQLQLLPDTLVTKMIVDKVIWATWGAKVFSVDNTVSAQKRISQELTDRGIGIYVSRAITAADSNGYPTWSLLDDTMDNVEITDFTENAGSSDPFNITVEDKRTKSEVVIDLKSMTVIRKANKILVVEGVAA